MCSVFIGNRVAYYDTHYHAIRHEKCLMLVEGAQICQQCKLYRNNSLMRQLNRIDEENLVEKGNRSHPQSHANYRFLSCTEKDERMKQLHTQLRNKTRMLQML